MNNHTIEGLRAINERLLAALKSEHYLPAWVNNHPEDCETCVLIAEIEALPKGEA